ncbi:unnamed protein product [Microthlaspi erraticum]|uniref:Cytochrome P450 n=1 Tax=Microthlaspi erraticum TaxID=1685480 RepID=A0A6D2KQR3_9BRAS|nr:unnamed protein product [Microthlaspi erraticum]
MVAAMMNVDFQNCFFFFILLCFFSLFCYSLFLRKPKVGCDLPPSPWSLPIIGHLHLLLSVLIHKSLHRLSSKYGPLLHLRIFNFPLLVASSASAVYEIHRTHDRIVSSRGLPPIEECLIFGSSSFINAPYGDHWKFTKRLIVTNMLGTQALERSRGVRADELERFYTDLVNKAVKNESVEIFEEAMKLSHSSIYRMIMGKSFPEENGETERVRGLVAEFVSLTKKFVLAKKLGVSLFRKNTMSASHRFDELLDRILQEHEENPDEHHGTEIMRVSMKACRETKRITRSHIKSLFVELFLAGTETSAQAIQWTMAEIVKNPKALVRLREEIDSVVGETRLVQETDLPNLPYLKAVVKEGLRLHPPSPLSVRTFQERCEIEGLCVQEKTTLVINAYAVMRDPDYWEDPDEFKPERFLASSRSEQAEESREQSLKYIPFGSGRRGCPGANLASIFVETAVGTMVQGFDWGIKGREVNMDEAIGGMNLTMAHPLKLTPVVRTSNLLIPSFL